MYELMVVSTTDGVSSLFEKVEKFLKEAEASSIKSEKLGRKQLAYPIAKQTDAEFLLFNFEAPTASVAEINNKIRLEQGTVLRYLLIKTKPLKVRKVRDVRKVQEGKSTEERKEEVNPPADGEVKPKVTVTTRPPSSGKAGLRRASPPATKAVASKKVAKPVESKSIKGTKGSKSIKGKSKR